MYIATIFKYIIHAIVVLLIVTISCEIPSYIYVCQRNNPKLSACIENSINTLIPYLKVGIPELDVPPLEPLQMNNIQLKLGSDTGQIATNISDIHVWGASLFELVNLRVNLSSNTFDFKVIVPTIRLHGQYEIDTKILFIHLKGKGPITININDYRFNCTMKGYQVEKNNAVYLEFEKMDCTINFRDANVHLENLFNGNVLLGNATNGAINDNINVFFHEIKPTLTQALEETFTKISNKITMRFTYHELFP